MRQNYDTPSIAEALITYPFGHLAMTGHGPTDTRNYDFFCDTIRLT